MRAEEKPVTILTTKLDGLGRTPGVAPYDRFVPTQFMRLLDDQSDLVVVLGGKQHVRPGLNNLGQLGAEISILGCEALIRHNRTGAMNFFPGFFKKFGQAFGIIAGHIVKDGGFFVSEFFGHKIGQDRSLKRIQEAAPEDKGTIVGGIRVGRPGADHRCTIVVGNITRRYGLFG